MFVVLSYRFLVHARHVVSLLAVREMLKLISVNARCCHAYTAQLAQNLHRGAPYLPKIGVSLSNGVFLVVSCEMVLSQRVDGRMDLVYTCAYSVYTIYACTSIYEN